jgi:hypothetical protein
MKNILFRSPPKIGDHKNETPQALKLQKKRVVDGKLQPLCSEANLTEFNIERNAR